MTKQFVGVMALLASSVGSAATLTVVPSSLNPNIGDTFTVTLNATNAANIGGITVKFAWDITKVAFTTALSGTNCPACQPATGPVGVGTGTFDVVTGPNGARILDVLPGAPPVNGDFPLAVLTFQALAAGSMNLIVNDDGGVTTGWFDNDTAELVPTSYVQSNVIVQGAAVPVPAAAWLLVSALGTLGVLKRRPS
jgi:hypothetical protein